MPSHFPPATHIEAHRLVAAFRAHPSRLFIETSSRCDRNCFVCGKQPPVRLSVHGDMDLATFDALKEAFPQLNALILNGIGEPLLNHNLEIFISQGKRCIPSQSWIGFQTNGHLLSNLRALSLVDAGLDRICLTVDDNSLSSFGTDRSSVQLSDLEQALSAIASSKAICSRPDLLVGVEFVAATDNLRRLPAAIGWAAARGANFAIVSEQNSLAEAAAPHCTYGSGFDEALSLYQAWKGKADHAGVNIDRYFELLWKQERTHEEQRVINFVESMRTISRQHRKQLATKQSAGPDSSCPDAIEKAFERARLVARETGIDLRLPYSEKERRDSCDSIERAAAFISWDGVMYPGYHIRYHDQPCTNAWLHPMQTTVSGNVLKSGVLDIWNSAEFRSYRRNTQKRCTRPSPVATDPASKHDINDYAVDRASINGEPCSVCRRSPSAFRCME